MYIPFFNGIIDIYKQVGDVILKKIIALITVIVLTLSFAACTRETEETIKDTESDTTSSKENTVTEKEENSGTTTDDNKKGPNITVGSDKGKDEPAVAVICPNFVGMKISDIINNPDYKDDFEIIEKWEYNSEIEYGCVFEQSEKAGGAIAKGAKITLKVSMGQSTEKVPNVVGETEAYAVSLLKARGFKIKIVNEYSDSCEEGYVIKTDPQQTTVVKEGETITVYVSMGKDPNKQSMDGYTPWR